MPFKLLQPQLKYGLSKTKCVIRKSDPEKSRKLSKRLTDSKFNKIGVIKA